MENVFEGEQKKDSLLVFCLELWNYLEQIVSQIQIRLVFQADKSAFYSPQP